MKILKAQIPPSLSKHIFAYFDKFLGYAHFYIYDVCSLPWHRRTFIETGHLTSQLQSANLFKVGEGEATVSLAFLICSNMATTSFEVLKHSFSNAQRLLPPMGLYLSIAVPLFFYLSSRRVLQRKVLFQHSQYIKMSYFPK